MTDPFGREITYLRLSVTDKCNLRCRYCMPEEGVALRSHDDMLTEEELLQAVRAASDLGITKVRITGGEPLIKKNILSICHGISATAGIRETAITTNGILLPKFAKELKDAGIGAVNISLDTLNAEKYREMTRGGNLEDALSGIDAALNTGFRKVKINTVLIGGFNDTEIRDLARLTLEKPLDVRFIELMPMTEHSFGPEAFLSTERVLQALPELIPDGIQGTAALYHLPGGLGQIGIIHPVSAGFCGSCNRLRLTADGFIKPCLHNCLEYHIKGMNEAEMKQAFLDAVRHKPARHAGLSAGKQSLSGRSMHTIGG